MSVVSIMVTLGWSFRESGGRLALLNMHIPNHLERFMVFKGPDSIGKKGSDKSTGTIVCLDPNGAL